MNKLLDRLKELSERELLEVSWEMNRWKSHPLIADHFKPLVNGDQRDMDRFMNEWRSVRPYINDTLSRKQQLHYHNVEKGQMSEEEFQRLWRTDYFTL